MSKLKATFLDAITIINCLTARSPGAWIGLVQHYSVFTC